MSDKRAMDYSLGGKNQLKWKDKYFFGPKGNGYLEPGVVGLDDATMSAYNVAKSSYQIHPEVFNLPYLSKATGLTPDDIRKRMLRMYDEHYIMYVMNPATQVYGWGLYYWFVKLKEGTAPEDKARLSEWFQNKDDICTGYECTGGDFDFYNGNHMRVLDNLLSSVIGPWRDDPMVEFVHICPVRRCIRESHISMWDALPEHYRENYWGEGQLEKLARFQDKLDIDDLKIIKALNDKKPVKEMFDFEVLAKISGLDPKEMARGFTELVEQKRIIVPLIYLNFEKLGLTHHAFVIRMFQTTPTYRKLEIVDELSDIGEFSRVTEFSDAFYDAIFFAYNEISDIDALRKKLQRYAEIEEIKEANIPRMYRRWVCRLDEQNGYWEECVFTDDFLEDRTNRDAPEYCPILKKMEVRG
ncbi:MAG: AsnC family transcriptional regulator [Proteobacteria bacterium]|nr:MAG: AsnC family transcriptional regulator [Pseudomonadota bacterium]